MSMSEGLIDEICGQRDYWKGRAKAALEREKKLLNAIEMASSLYQNGCWWLNADQVRSGRTAKPKR